MVFGIKKIFYQEIVNRINEVNKDIMSVRLLDNYLGTISDSVKKYKHTLKKLVKQGDL